MKNHIFIEGLQGSGKSTLLRNLSRKFPEYKAYYEGGKAGGAGLEAAETVRGRCIP